MGARAFVWFGGALFVASLICCAWSYLVPFGRAAAPGRWPALVADAALLTAFAVHHSLFARAAVKVWLSRRVSGDLLRSTYVWIASLLLMLVALAWQPIGSEIYRATGLMAVALTAVQVAGLWVTARAVARIDPLELAGIHPAARCNGLQVSGPYGWVRHPLYFGWTLMTFGTPHMTADRLVFAAVTTAYLIVAIPWEERSLRQSFGDAYADYVRDVRWRIIPFIY